MEAERYFQRELSLINPLYFAVYNTNTRKWNVRKWRSPYRKHNWQINSDVVMAVKYPVLDGRSLYDLKRGLWQARRIKYLMHEIDEANRINEQKIDEEDLALHREGARDIYNHYKSNTVDLGGTHKAKSVVHY